MTGDMFLLTLVAPFLWIIGCACYFAMTFAEPTNARFGVMFVPVVLIMLIAFFHA
jgi:hypothetical protein